MVGGGMVGLFAQPEITKLNFKAGRWTTDELVRIIPETISKDLISPCRP